MCWVFKFKVSMLLCPCFSLDVVTLDRWRMPRLATTFLEWGDLQSSA